MDRASRVGVPHPEIAELVPVDPREVWGLEVSFSQWLSENLGRISALIGLDLQLEERESAVGKYFADIVAKEVGGNRKVVIENQFGMTDHDHLGKLLTYSAGKKADISIWIAPAFTDPHRATLEWLNEVSRETQLFYGVSLQLVRVENSTPAVKLELVVQPNAFVKQETTPTSPRGEKYRKFFTDLVEALKGEAPDLTRASRGNPASWFFFRTGRSSFFYCVEFVQQPARLRVSLYVWSPSAEVNKQYFDLLVAERQQIEDAFGGELSWERRDRQKTSLVAAYRAGSIDDGEDALVAHRAWAIATLKRLRASFGPRIAALPRLPTVTDENDRRSNQQDETDHPVLEP